VGGGSDRPAATPGPRGGVAVLGNYGNRNLGDEAGLATLLQFLGRHYPGLAVCALSERPEETRQRHGIEAVYSSPARKRNRPEERSAAGPSGGGSGGEPVKERSALRTMLKRLPLVYRGLQVLAAVPGAVVRLARTAVFLVQSFALLRRVRVLVIGGGGQISDHFEGIWGFPLQLFAWSLLARCAGAQILVLNVGAGPLNLPASRMLFRWTLRLATYRSHRDERSRRLLEEIGLTDPVPVVPDLVFAWKPATTAVGPADGRPPAKRAVGVNAFPFRDRRYWPIGDDAAYHAYLDVLGRFVHWLLEEGYQVRLFPTQLKADTRVIADVMEGLTPTLSSRLVERLSVARIDTVDDLAASVRDRDVIVATRFHGIVMSMLAGRPILALCNEPKMADLMADMGQERHCLPLEGLTLDVLRHRFWELEADSERAAAEIRERAARASDALEQQLAAVFRPLFGPSAAPAATGSAAGPPSAMPLPRPQEPAL
jgi:polysaccharide pyruvyl transferase WcaK-like protein